MRYLTPDWIDAADQAVRQSEEPPPVGRVVIDQIVDGATSYRITIDGAASSISAIDANVSGTANARFTQSLATATAVAQGTTDAHQAFLLGHIRFEGDVNLLIERRDTIAWLETALASVLAQTTF